MAELTHEKPGGKKPAIVKIIQTELEERAPPDEEEYEFILTWPPQKTEGKNT